MAATGTETELAGFLAGLADWADAAAVAVERVRYGVHPDQVVDVRDAGAAGPVTLVLHGGFWRPRWTSSSTDALSVALARSGRTSANAEYRRLGPGRWRELLDDVEAAARVLRPALAIGHSAGGQLALWLAARGLVPAAVALGGVCDLGAAARANLGGGAVQDLLGDDPAAYEAADPAGMLPLGVSQLLVHGRLDDTVPVEHARAYAARAQAAGDDCRLLELEDADHFDVIDPRHPCFERILAALTGTDGGRRGGS